MKLFAQGGGPINSWVGWMKMHPYIVAGTVTAGIAIPVALASTDFGNGVGGSDTGSGS